MKIFIGGSCKPDNIFSLVDPSSFSEAAFEAHVQAALSCVYPDYHCVVFRGAYEFDGELHEADLALIHKSFSHWFVIEVELVVPLLTRARCSASPLLSVWNATSLLHKQPLHCYPEPEPGTGSFSFVLGAAFDGRYRQQI